MRAVVYEKYGPPEVLQLRDVPQPTPGPGEVLVKVHATTVNRTDCGFRTAKPFVVRFLSGLLRPKRTILGSEYAGEVAAVGAGVEGFAVGDPVFGVHEGFGAWGEYLCVGQSTPLAPKPANLSFEEAAAVCDGAILAWTYLRRVGLGKQQRILVYGASESIGTAGVQLARQVGAHVTAVCNTDNVSTVRSLGADEVIDYLQDDFTANGQTYDVIFDAVGKLSFRRCRRSLTRKGIFTATDGGFLWQNPLLALLTLPSRGRKVLFPLPKYTKEDVLLHAELIEAGEYRAVVDRRYPLEDVVEATRYVETEQKTGNVVLVVTPAG